MHTRRLRRATLTVAAILFVAVAPTFGLHAQRADTSFAGLVARLSEGGGYFDSDNIITNEASYLQIASQLEKNHVRGGVYLGVGPDQNFSYVALIRPTIAFMVDIRRDNMLEHLLFKSLFAMSRNRAEYLCMLLGRQPPADVAQWKARPTADILAYVAHAPVDSAFVAATRKESNDRITALKLTLDQRDRTMIDRYRSEFISSGLDTRYSSIGRNNRADYPSFGELIGAADRAGHQIGYLANEDAFQFVRSMQLADRIVPIVGNVAGDRAVKAIGAYATEHQQKISAFYLSNVEQYLMGRDGGFDQFAQNVATLPRDRSSVIIRSYFGRWGAWHPLYIPASGNLSTSMIEPMDSFVHRFEAGTIHSYNDLVFNGFVTP